MLTRENTTSEGITFYYNSIVENSKISFFYDNFDTFVNSSINNWYTNILEIIAPDYMSDFEGVTYSYFNILLYYPLWCMWCYLFKLITNCLVAIPKLLNNLISKIGGGKNDN